MNITKEASIDIAQNRPLSKSEQKQTKIKKLNLELKAENASADQLYNVSEAASDESNQENEFERLQSANDSSIRCKYVEPLNVKNGYEPSEDDDDSRFEEEAKILAAK